MNRSRLRWTAGYDDSGGRSHVNLPPANHEAKSHYSVFGGRVRGSAHECRAAGL